MDFAMRYSPAQDAFRHEVRTWLQENVPAGLGEPQRSEEDPHADYLRRRALGRLLGAKGWLYPTAPREYGGGGMDIPSMVVLEEEMQRLDLSLPPYYDSGWIAGPTILAWGTDEQKQELLPPIFRGEVRTWQLLTEPEAGSDLASVKLSARRDGDEYVLNGQKVFVGGAHGAERFWMIVCTDRAGRRHENLSWFMVDAASPGVTVQALPVLADVAEGHKNTVFFDNVRVPADRLVGGENKGWRAASTHLELEHGVLGGLVRDSLVDELVQYCRTHERNGRPMIDDPDVRDGLTEIFIRLEIVRLLNTRNFWRNCADQKVAYNGPQVMYLWKITGLWLTKAMLDLLGPAALTDDDTWGALAGRAESQQRSGIVDIVPGGTIDVQRVLIARALGVGRPIR